MTTGLVWDERFMWHDTGTRFGPIGGLDWMEPVEPPESAPGKRRIKNLLDASGLSRALVMLAPAPASDADLLRVHTQAHLDHVAAVSAAGGGNVARRFATTRVGADGEKIARLAAGAGIAAVDAVLAGTADNAYCLHRPPGHHAEPDEAMGFCIYANAAIAGAYALDAGGLARIAFVDWDAHHGNGTQAAFWTDPRALAISLHQDCAFPPGSGAAEETGEGAGAGTNINIPLPPGSGEGAYLAAFERVVLPALTAFRPDLIFVPSGFDSGGHDPLARMMLTSESFRRMTELLLAAAGDLCGGRIVMLHEGGYAPHIVPFMALAVFEALAGETTGVTDPFLPALAGNPWQALQPHQDRAIAAAERAGLAAFLAR
ncbi:MAG: class II histone deacetylase [Rhodospirillaceae bacterium]|nr:class II histone deacetylase [Rhodospirillaceae bacterium]MDE0620026.1 class II histone deacetylase [Rhodospirillaceae bacterium]